MDIKKKKINFINKRTNYEILFLLFHNLFFYPIFLASLKQITKRNNEIIPVKLKAIGVYSTKTLPNVKPIIE